MHTALRQRGARRARTRSPCAPPSPGRSAAKPRTRATRDLTTAPEPHLNTQVEEELKAAARAKRGEDAKHKTEDLERREEERAARDASKNGGDEAKAKAEEEARRAKHERKHPEDAGEAPVRTDGQHRKG